MSNATIQSNQMSCSDGSSDVDVLRILYERWQRRSDPGSPDFYIRTQTCLVSVSMSLCPGR
jgi:hypothetical protein